MKEPHALYISRFAADLMYTYSFGHTKETRQKSGRNMNWPSGMHELTLNTLSSGYGGRHNIRFGDGL